MVDLCQDDEQSKRGGRRFCVSKSSTVLRSKTSMFHLNGSGTPSMCDRLLCFHISVFRLEM